MTIKVSAAVKAMRALDELYNRPIEDTWTVKTLYNLRCNLEPVTRFQRERERQLIEMNHGTLTGDQVRFEKAEDFQAYMKGREELNDTEMDVDWTPVKIKAVNIGPLSMKILDGLAGLIELE